MSSDVAWAITRNSSAFLLKKRGCPKPFSTDPLNLTNKHSQRYSGIVNPKAIGLAPGPDNKGFTVVIKKPKKIYKPGLSKTHAFVTLSNDDCQLFFLASSKSSIVMKAGARRSLRSLKGLIVKQRYRKDLVRIFFYLITSKIDFSSLFFMKITDQSSSP